MNMPLVQRGWVLTEQEHALFTLLFWATWPRFCGLYFVYQADLRRRGLEGLDSPYGKCVNPTMATIVFALCGFPIHLGRPKLNI